MVAPGGRPRAGADNGRQPPRGEGVTPEDWRGGQSPPGGASMHISSCLPGGVARRMKTQAESGCCGRPCIPDAGRRGAPPALRAALRASRHAEVPRDWIVLSLAALATSMGGSGRPAPLASFDPGTSRRFDGEPWACYDPAKLNSPFTLLSREAEGPAL